AVALFRNQMPWQVQDPVFGRDIAFYLFTLPVYRLALQLLNVVLVLSLLMAAGVYFLTGNVRAGEGRFSVHPAARIHLGLLVAALLLLKAVGYWLGAYDLLQSTRGVAFGASYTDLHAVLPALRILTVIALLAAGAA